MQFNERTFDVARADRLEDPERLRWLPPGEVIGALELRAGENVADVGAGTGYFALPLAAAVAPGHVFAVDMQAAMLERLRAKLAVEGVHNVVPVAGTALDTTLAPESSDLVFLANVWHELDDHGRVLAECARILTTHGRVAIVDWRGDAAPPPGPPAEHRIHSSSVKKTLEAAGWKVERHIEVGSYHYVVRAVR